MPSKCACGKCGLKVSFAGNYRKGCKPLGASCDPAGKAKAHNDINNPINNPINSPINSLKRKIALRADTEAYLIEHGRTGILSDKLRMEIVEAIATNRSLFDGHTDKRLHGKSLDDLFDDPTFSGYLGETGRSLIEEAYGWLTERGSLFHASGKGRPVLRWKHGYTLITADDAQTMLGFNSVFLWKNDEKPNTTFVEDRLQGRYHELGLPRRLHRQVGMGDNGFYIEPKEVELHKQGIPHLLVRRQGRDRR